MNTIVQRLQANYKKFPNKPAIIYGENKVTYSDFEIFFSKIHKWILDKDIETNTVAFIFLPQSPDAILWFFGLMSIGFIPAFMPLPSIKQDNEKYWNNHKDLINITKPSLIITTEEWHNAFENITNEFACTIVTDNTLNNSQFDKNSFHIKNNKIAFLQHSSGTTGLKKGVALSHQAVLKQIDSYSISLKSSNDDVIVSWLPMYHDMGLIACTIMPLINGQTIVLIDPFIWVNKPIILFQEITKHKGTLVWLPNFSFEHLRRTISNNRFENLNLASVRAFINCSEPCKYETFERFYNHFKEINVTEEQLQVCYAMAETVYAVSQTKIGQRVKKVWVNEEALLLNKLEINDSKIGKPILSCGKVIEGCRVEIFHPDNKNVIAEEKVGEIVISGDFLFEGYYHRENITKDVYDGYRYFTRDIGFIFEDELYILGRKDDLIICNGRNYYAHEIEQFVNSLNNIKPGRNVALGVYNEQIGSNEIYLIQENRVKSEFTENEEKSLKKKIRKDIQEYMGLLLRDVIFVDPGWLHKSSSGKISRSLNKQKLVKYLKKH